MDAHVAYIRACQVSEFFIEIQVTKLTTKKTKYSVSESEEEPPILNAKSERPVPVDLFSSKPPSEKYSPSLTVTADEISRRDTVGESLTPVWQLMKMS